MFCGASETVRDIHFITTVVLILIVVASNNYISIITFHGKSWESFGIIKWVA